MAGRQKQGIDYSGWSVDIFDGDKKIDKLLDAKGWKGFGIYFFLCQRAYKVNGYRKSQKDMLQLQMSGRLLHLRPDPCRCRKIRKR